MRGNVYKKGTTHRKRKHALLHLPEVNLSKKNSEIPRMSFANVRPAL